MNNSELRIQNSELKDTGAGTALPDNDKDVVISVKNVKKMFY